MSRLFIFLIAVDIEHKSIPRPVLLAFGKGILVIIKILNQIVLPARHQVMVAAFLL